MIVLASSSTKKVLFVNSFECFFDFLKVDDYQNAFGLFKYYNRSINYADCTILQSMQNHGITRIVSFDSDFDKIKGIQRITGF